MEDFNLEQMLTDWGVYRMILDKHDLLDDMFKNDLKDTPEYQRVSKDLRSIYGEWSEYLEHNVEVDVPFLKYHGDVV